MFISALRAYQNLNFDTLSEWFYYATFLAILTFLSPEIPIDLWESVKSSIFAIEVV